MLKQDVCIYRDCAFRVSFHPCFRQLVDMTINTSVSRSKFAKDPLFQEGRPALTAWGAAEISWCQVRFSALTVPGIHSSRILNSVSFKGGLSSLRTWCDSPNLSLKWFTDLLGDCLLCSEMPGGDSFLPESCGQHVHGKLLPAGRRCLVASIRKHGPYWCAREREACWLL